MSADPIVYCLEQLTDYAEFERLCHDLMALEGYPGIEPLGGSKDKGRDAIHTHRSTEEVTIFAYSVREDWRRKLTEDAENIQKHGHVCQRLVFLCTASFTATERDSAVTDIRQTFGWTLELYGLERLRSMLASTYRQLVAQYPQIFCPPFFPSAGGLSLGLARDHVVIDHVDADAGLAHWLARRLTLAGYHVWCRGLAPLAGSSVSETVRGLLLNRAFRYICILSPRALADPDFNARRSVAHTIEQRNGHGVVLPALAEAIEGRELDDDTRRLEPARFTDEWIGGLRQIEDVLAAENCPRKKDGASQIAARSYFPADIVLAEPEILASNLFPAQLPAVIHRFYSEGPAADEQSIDLSTWGHRTVGRGCFLSFHHPPREVARQHKLLPKGGAVWRGLNELDGVNVGDLVIELLKKCLYAECRRRGLRYCPERDVHYFPFGLLKHDRLNFAKLNGDTTFFNVAGERTHGKGDHARKYRYHIAPVFAPKIASVGGYEIITRIRLRLTDAEGTLLSARTAISRRKKVCKSWWNDEWLARTMGVMQFLAGGSDLITIGDSEDEKIVIDPQPRTWKAPVRLNEAAMGDAIRIRQEEEPHLRDPDSEDDDE